MSKTDKLKGWNPERLTYEPFDPVKHKKLAEELEDRMAHLIGFHHLGKSSNIESAHFTNFTYHLQQGWPSLTYVSYAVDAPGGGQYMFWLTDRHAEAIGKALVPTLKTFRLDMTRLEHDGFSVMSDAARDDLAVKELCIAHCSGDEVSAVEARGLAKLVTKLRCRTLHLWAREFDPGSLDALAEELTRLGNAKLRTIDVCDTSKKEPDDAIHHPGLAGLAKRNRRK